MKTYIYSIIRNNEVIYVSSAKTLASIRNELKKRSIDPNDMNVYILEEFQFHANFVLQDRLNLWNYRNKKGVLDLDSYTHVELPPKNNPK